MAISLEFDRPKSATTNDETVDLTIAATQTGSSYTIDFHYTTDDITGEKLAYRLVLTPEVVGMTTRIKVVEYVFSGGGTYVSATDPANSTATSTKAIATGSALDLDALLTAGGDARSV